MESFKGLSQQEKATQFRDLHHNGRLLILPNIWDSLGAMLLENLGYPAVATASASIAFTNGYDDGENIPFETMLTLIRRITGSVNVPVTADIESGYAENDIVLAENMRKLLETGVVGINFEDSDKHTKSLFPIDVQARRISVIKKAAKEFGVDLFVNARTDVYIKGKEYGSADAQLEEAMKRGIAYKAAGADCFYPLGIQDEIHIKTIVDQLAMPVNILMIPGIPGFDRLTELGVARISLGPSFLKIAIRAMKETAMQLKNYEGMNLVTSNEITSDYLRTLVSGRFD
jgi:2-methylisocitrate lyase-like PEP mutase family enzyme